MWGTFVLAGLLAAGGQSQIIVNVNPSSAQVLVDGKAVSGFQSGKAFSVAAGKRRVTARADGYTEVSKTVSVKAGGTSIVSLRLKRATSKRPAAKAPVTKRPTTKRPATKRPATAAHPSKRPFKPSARPQPPTKRPAARPSKRPITRRPTKPAPTAGPTKTIEPTPTKRPTKRPATKRPATKHPATKSPTRRPVARPRPAAAPAPAPVANDTRDTGPSSTKPWAVLSFIVGGLAITGGVVAGLAANDAADNFNQSTNRTEKMGFKDDTKNLALVSNVLYGVGATGMVLGAVLWAMDPGPGARADVGPLPGGGAYVGVTGSF